MDNSASTVIPGWNVSTVQIQSILKQQYSLEGTLQILVGELDLNLKLTTQNGSFLIKISSTKRSLEWLTLQNQIIQHVAKREVNTTIPIANHASQFITYCQVGEASFYIRVLHWIDGQLMADLPQVDNPFFQSLGQQIAQTTQALIDFQPSYQPKHDWDSNQVEWIFAYRKLIPDSIRTSFDYFEKQIMHRIDRIRSLRQSFIHNDINDHNIVVQKGAKSWRIAAIIDWGDSIQSSSIHDLAIACSYALNYGVDPIETLREIVVGYHKKRPLLREELALLYTCIAIRIMISLVKSTINKVNEPSNQYHQVSHDAMKQLLVTWHSLNEEFITPYLLFHCDFDPFDSKHLENWLINHQVSISDLFPTVHFSNIHCFDLGLLNAKMGHMKSLADPFAFQQKLNGLKADYTDSLWVGGYMEIRGIYQHEMYQVQTNLGYCHRSQHLGVDFWLPPTTAIHSPFDGQVIFYGDNGQNKDYGYTLIVKHTAEDQPFYLLYGHLMNTSLVKTGDAVQKGQLIARIGDVHENGHWCPHLHLQMITDMLDQKTTFYGVCNPSEEAFWKHICPNPNLIFKEDFSSKKQMQSIDSLKVKREKSLGKSLSLQYDEPLYIIRGDGMYLIDIKGQKYIDTVNNVAHVGHENPSVVQAGIDQMTLLNTNTRYVHHLILDYATALLGTHDEQLEVAYFVNSGSEANELAIRMAKQMTGSDEFVVIQHGYHGNTNATVSISSYKFDGKGGKGAEETIHVLPLPDSFRGKYTGEDVADQYLRELEIVLEKIKTRGKKPAALIIEPIISCGGQIVLPAEFLKKSFNMIRHYGGLAIADEVQVGLGRMGSHWWAYQEQDAQPDIVSMGKPLGNGHPIGAVVCRQEVADAFTNGMEFFNTFGGNPVSCAIGLAVIKQIQDQNLMENARIQGAYFTEKLIQLATRFPIIADIRGVGLFLGFELCDRNNKPLEKAATTLVNSMKKRKVLMSTDGPDHNVIKIKPPIIIQKHHIDYITEQLTIVLSQPLFDIDNNV